MGHVKNKQSFVYVTMQLVCSKVGEKGKTLNQHFGTKLISYIQEMADVGSWIMLK